MSNHVDILLASYNGEKYIALQLDSILQQRTDVPFRIVVNDDGSRDGTVRIVQDYARRHPNVVLLEPAPERLGVVRNFERLLSHSDAPYLLLSDQDDVWLPDKLETCLDQLRALEARSGGAPCLIYHDMQVVDGDLNTIHSSLNALNARPPQPRLSSLLIENPVAGCTAAFNRPLCDLALPMPAEAYFHDWWLALLAQAGGELCATDRRLGQYRLHGSNTVGVQRRSLARKLYNFVFRAGVRDHYLIAVRQAWALHRRLVERGMGTRASRSLVAAFVATGAQSMLGRKINLVRHHFLPRRRSKMLSTVFGLW